MKTNKIIYAISAIVMTCSMLNAEYYDAQYSHPAALSTAEFEFLLPHHALTKNQIVFLSDFMEDPRNPTFKDFSKEKILRIDLAIKFHEAELNQKALAQYRMYQLTNSGMTPKEAITFQKTTTLLVDGKLLNKSQNQSLKHFILKNMVEHPDLCLLDFFPSLVIHVKKNPKVFNENEGELLKNAALFTATLTPTDIVILKKMAEQGSINTPTLGNSEILALAKLTSLAGLKLINVCDPSSLLTLQVIMLDHAHLFNTKNLNEFHSAVDNSAAVIKFKKENPHFNVQRRVMMNQNGQHNQMQPHPMVNQNQHPMMNQNRLGPNN